MSATATDLGGGSLGTFMPTTFAAMGGAQAALEAPLADAEVQLDGAIEAKAEITIQPPSLDLAAALEAAASIPGVQVSVEAMDSLALQLGVEIGALKLAIEALLKITGQFAAGVRAYALEGATGDFGGALGGKLAGGVPGGGGPTQNGFGIVLVASAPDSILALKTLFAV